MVKRVRVPIVSTVNARLEERKRLHATEMVFPDNRKTKYQFVEVHGIPLLGIPQMMPIS